jgi:hypothetical protein
VIVDGGNISFSPAADFPDGGLAEAPGGKDFAGGLQKALPGFRAGGSLRIGSFQFFSGCWLKLETEYF